MTEQPSLKDTPPEEIQAELDRIFDYHPPGKLVDLHQAWRSATKAFATQLMSLPPTRERAMAITRLEECSFWIHATIARNHETIEVQQSEDDERKPA